MTDARGSVRDVVQQGALSGGKMTAKVVDHVIYDAYGNASQAAAFATLALPRFGFDGMRFDAATGFYLSMTRPYDPRTGDWVKPDWIGFLGGQANLSEFCGNDPTNATDPSGMAWWNAYIFDNVYEWYRGSKLDDQIRDVRIRQAQQEEARASGDPFAMARDFQKIQWTGAGNAGAAATTIVKAGLAVETTAGLAATESQARGRRWISR